MKTKHRPSPLARIFSGIFAITIMLVIGLAVVGAQERRYGSGLLCDTHEQTTTFWHDVLVRKITAQESIDAINAEAKKPHACAFVAPAVFAVEEWELTEVREHETKPYYFYKVTVVGMIHMGQYHSLTERMTQHIVSVEPFEPNHKQTSL